MDKATFMEKLIGMFAGRERAASMIGDLLESSASGGRFWISSLGLLASVAWKPVVGLILAYLSIGLTWVPAIHFLGFEADHFMALKPGSVERVAFEPWLGWALLLGVSAMQLVLIAVFASVCYGFRDSATKVSVMLAAWSFALCWLLQVPGAIGASICISVLVVGAGLVLKGFRNSTLVVITALLIGNLLGYILVHLVSRPFMAIALLLIPLVEVLVIVRMHRAWIARRTAIA